MNMPYIIQLHITSIQPTNKAQRERELELKFENFILQGL